MSLSLDVVVSLSSAVQLQSCYTSAHFVCVNLSLCVKPYASCPVAVYHGTRGAMRVYVRMPCLQGPSISARHVRVIYKKPPACLTCWSHVLNATTWSHVLNATTYLQAEEAALWEVPGLLEEVVAKLDEEYMVSSTFI